MSRTKKKAPRTRVIDRVRARAEWASWRAQGLRVIEIRGKRRLQRLRVGMRPLDRLEIPVVFIGDEAQQRKLFRLNARVIRRA